MPDDSNLEKNKNFFDRWSSSYNHAIFQFWMKRFHKAAIKEIDFNKKAKILDISCGTGELLGSLWQKSNKNSYFGVDISDGMLKKAKERLPQRIKLSIMDVHNLSFPDNYFDYVISTEAFHHYGNQAKALTEMKRVCKSNGRVIVVDINFFLFLIHYLFEKLEPGCKKINSKKEIYSLFKKAGFSRIFQKRNFLFSIITTGTKQ